jgi:cobalt-zinc-cadmium efflux system outer membrane protein
VAEPETALALDDALALALAGSPELAGLSWEAREGEAREMQAGTIPNPELEFRFLDQGLPDTDDEEARRRLMLSQVFELGGKRGSRVALAQSERELAAWDYEGKRAEIATVVASRFVAVLGAQRRVQSSRRLVELLEQTRDRVATLIQTGLMRSIEIHEITRQLGLARIDLKQAETAQATARFLLAATWGGGLPRFTEAVGDLEQVRPVPDLDRVLDLARQGPARARWDTERERGQAALDVAKAGRVPDLKWGVGVRWEEDLDERDYLVDLEIGLPVFDLKQGDIREARYGLARVEAESRAAEAASNAAIAELYYRLSEAEARCSTMGAEVLPASRAAFDAFRAGFDSQTASLGDLLDAARDLARAEIDRTDALVAYHQARAALEGAVGQSLAAAE